MSSSISEKTHEYPEIAALYKNTRHILSLDDDMSR